ncbi:MAG TPA: type II secretion system F family protein [Planctomycetota bacterium]|nr:type II secretion system F family protein [Planctomycetota bacterium]
MSTSVQIIIFVATTLGFLAIANFLTRARESQQRTKRLTGKRPDDRLAETRQHTDLKSLLLSVLEPAGRLFSSSRNQDKLKLDLHAAGIYGQRASTVFVGAKVAAAVALPVLFFIYRSFLGLPMNMTIICMAVLVVVGLRMPSFWLARRVKNRRERLRAELPDCLDLMVVCVESGLGIDAALLKISEKMAAGCPDLSAELRMVHLEMQAGQARQEALHHLGDRTGVKEIQSLVAKLIQSDKFGTSIAKSLRVHADAIREKRRQRAEEQAGKTAVKLLIPLVFLIFPALFVAILGPAVIQMLKALTGSGFGG